MSREFSLGEIPVPQARLDGVHGCALFPEAVHALLGVHADAVGQLKEAHVRAVVAEVHAVFRPGGEHAVRLFGAEGDQVVDHDADVGVGAAEDEWLLTAHGEGGVDAGHQALSGGFLVAGSAVGLPGDVEAGEHFGFQGGIQLGGVDVVVLHGVSRTDDFGVLQSGYGVDELFLHVFRQRGGDAVEVHFVGGESFRLDEDLVAGAIGELDHFVFDGGAVARPGADDEPGVEGAAAHVGFYDAVRLLGGEGDVALHLFPVHGAVGVGEGDDFLVAELRFHFAEVYGAAHDARRGAGFHAAHAEAEPGQRLFQAVSGGRGGLPGGSDAWPRR